MPRPDPTPLVLAPRRVTGSGAALALASAAAALLFLAGAVPLYAQSGGNAPVEALAKALSLRDVVEVMHQEGIAYGADLEAEMFEGQGGQSWTAAVEGIYSMDRIYPMIEARFAAELVERKADVPAMVAFFDGETGRKAVALEISARRAMLDEAVEDAARVKLDELRADEDPRIAAVEAYVEANNLVEENVSSGLNASLAFYRGLAEAGAFGEGFSDEDMLSDVWSQEAEIRAETEEWLYGFLVMAYAPMTDAELDAYTEFSRTDAGQDLNAALFAGFGDMFTDVSERLGRTAATYIVGSDL